MDPVASRKLRVVLVASGAFALIAVALFAYELWSSTALNKNTAASIATTTPTLSEKQKVLDVLAQQSTTTVSTSTVQERQRLLSHLNGTTTNPQQTSSNIDTKLRVLEQMNKQ